VFITARQFIKKPKNLGGQYALLGGQGAAARRFHCRNPKWLKNEMSRLAGNDLSPGVHNHACMQNN